MNEVAGALDPNTMFVELITDTPQPTLTRLGNKGVWWRLPNDMQWRQGSSGGWTDPNRLFWP